MSKIEKEPGMAVWLRQESTFGPWVECSPRDRGSVRFESATPAHKRPALEIPPKLPPLPEIGSLIPPEMHRDLHKMMRDYAMAALDLNR